MYISRRIVAQYDLIRRKDPFQRDLLLIEIQAFCGHVVYIIREDGSNFFIERITGEGIKDETGGEAVW